MSEIINVGYVASGVRNPYANYPPKVEFPASGGRSTRNGAEALTPGESPPVSTLRAAYLHSIRAQIDSGDFETPERIRGTVERLLDVVA